MLFRERAWVCVAGRRWEGDCCETAGLRVTVAVVVLRVLACNGEGTEEVDDDDDGDDDEEEQDLSVR